TAASAATPFVTTTIGAEGFDFTDGKECFITDDAVDFARKCLILLNDTAVWNNFSVCIKNTFAARFSPAAIAPKLLDVFIASKNNPGVCLLPVKEQIVSAPPKVAVITACYNSEKFLAETIESILAQTMQDFELWLLDDASADDTREIIADYAKRDARIKAVYFDDNTGPYVRRNYAIERTAAPFIVIHDGDDIMSPVKLEMLYNHIIADDNLGVIGHWYRSFIDEFKDVAHTDVIGFPLEQDAIRQTLLEHGSPLVHGAAIIRKQLFDRIGLYDANRAGSDSFWLEKAGLYWHHTQTMAFKNISDCLMLRRMHAASQTGSLPVFDPRGRRRFFRSYSAQVLDALAAQLRSGNSSDVTALFRQTGCGEFLEKYGDKIRESESQPLPEGMLLAFACKAIEFFNQGLFVSCINRLNGVETIVPDAAKRFKNFCLLKAIAFYALEMREKCEQYLETEIQNHDNPAARHFAADSLGNNVRLNVIDWCIVNDPTYDLRITEVQTTAISDTPDVNVSRSTPFANAADADGPLVSVIMPAYNAEKYIAEAVKSVLSQSYRTFELIVVDDGSTDRTRQIVTSFADERIQYIRKENGGASSARNRGIGESKGGFLITLDADDRMAPEYITAHMRHFAQHQDADMMYCDQRLIDEVGNFIKEIRQFEYQNRSHLIRDMFRCGYSVILPLGCFKRSVIEKIGQYDEALLIGEDYDLMRRFILHNCKAVHLPQTLYVRRMQPASLSRTNTQA
ncbi:MAG: glycosyltransferase, partial [Sedimentisphaerales bacterium]|nr:glycosyltransferase [Sedimentisphaerales bacterium]